MNDSNVNQFKDRYKEFKLTNAYKDRVKQLVITAVFKEIIRETLNNELLTNEHLTGFIQMFKFNGNPKNFNKYLVQNIPDDAKSKELSDLMAQTNQKGYTNVGRASIRNLSKDQLNIIKIFLQKAFTVSNIEEAVKLCAEFDAKKISEVTKGIYSPWLYYINPQIFPLTNNSHNKFREWLDLPADYPNYIKASNELKILVNESDLGILDMFAYSFDPDYRLQVLDLKGRNLFKISHGEFLRPRNKNGNIAKILEDKKWIAIGKYTGKGQANTFNNVAKIGDYIYLCYGGDALFCIGKIISEVKPLDKDYEQLIDGDNDWIYRDIEPLFFPKNVSIRNLKHDKQFHMPSGNSTFYEVPKNQLDYLNDSLFIPNFNLEIIDTTIGNQTSSEIKIDSKPRNTNTPPMNTILYGPPGTGKTYSTVDESLKLLDPKFTSAVREDMKKEFSKYQKEQRVFFTTFHQNMAYEDFIEGIKPLEPDPNDDFLKYDVQDGLFLKACIEATFNYLQTNIKQGNEVKKLLTFNAYFDILYDRIETAGSEQINTKSKKKKVTATITSQGNFSINHEGSEKPYTVSRDRLSKLYEKYPNPDEITNLQDAFRQVIGGCNATAYWSILKEITDIRLNQTKEQISELTIPISIPYVDKRKIVRDYWDKKDYTVLEKDNSDPYVFIIDEINRGNVAQIFGELITLIEDDKRMGKKETIYAELPYSKHSFSIPPNLYIIGTMNTADRSVEALDTALRRRFSFMPKMPEETLLKEEFDLINLEQLLTTINKRLRILKDNDHTIGHAWLFGITNFEQLKTAFKDKIIPLLQEYFYNDYEKLGLVLGEKLILMDVKVDADFFADFKDSQGLKGQYLKKKTYKIKPDTNEQPWEPSDFLSIYSKPPLPEQENV